MVETTMTDRDRVREEIRAEIAKHDPIDDARTALEILAETSIEFVEDGPADYRVVDREGRTRTILRDGKEAELTIHDLVAELREKHPTLFRSGAAADQSAPVAPVEAITEAPAAPDPGPPADAPPLQRDWLHLGSDLPSTGRRALAGPVQKLRAAGLDYGRSIKNGLRARLRAASDGAVARIASSKAEPSTDPVGQTPAAEVPDSAPPAKRPVRRVLVYGTAAVAIVVAVGASALLPGADPDPSGRMADPRKAEPAQARKAPEPTVTGGLPPGERAPAAPAAPPRSEGPVTGVPEVIDTATLRVDGKVVRLFGVEWARGGQAEDLTRYLQGREVGCAPAGSPELYRCQIDGRDLSEVVLYNGGGRATAAAPPELVAAENHAKSEKLGVWRK